MNDQCEQTDLILLHGIPRILKGDQYYMTCQHTSEEIVWRIVVVTDKSTYMDL
jgi:protoheme ferro-lyase